MNDFTKWIDPRNWMWWALGVAAVVAGLWFGVISPYNNYVSAKAVAAALEDEREFTTPKIAALESTVAELDLKIAQINEDSDAEKARQTAVVTQKTKELSNALAQNKTLKTDLARLHGLSAELDGVLNTIAAINNSASGASASTRLIKLGAAHSQCERDYRASRTEHSETLGRLDEALAVVRALKN